MKGIIILLISFLCLSQEAATPIRSTTNSPASTNSIKVTPTVKKAVMLGNENLVDLKFKPVQGKRIGLLTNRSGINSHGKSTIEILHKAAGVKLAALFAPEHGLDGTIPAGKEYGNSTDPETGVPIYSLYGPGPVRKPTAEMLKNLDAVVYDIQDTGCRSYTFISTMGLTMEACGENNVEFIVLDRPNPLGGERIEGPLLNPQYKSLVSQWNIPYVYGMTCGELARMINREGWIKKPCKLTIVRMQGWQRDMAWKDTQIPWVPTSPKIPYAHSPLHYVSTGLLGSMGSGINLGLDLEMPFECVLMQKINPTNFIAQMNRYKLPGIRFTPHQAEIKGQKYYGIRVIFTDPIRAPLTALNFYFHEAIKKVANRDLYAESVQAKKSFNLFDKVCGTSDIRRSLAAGVSAVNLARSWKADEDKFREKRQKYLLY